MNTGIAETVGELDTTTELGNIEKPSTFYWAIVGLHLLVVALNCIPLFFYFQRSWQLEHYQFFPIALVVFAYVIYSRIQFGVIRESRWSFIACAFLLTGSILSFLVAINIYSNYLPSVGVFLAIASLLNCLQDRETQKSLFPTWFLLVPLIRIPLNLDITLITQLQTVSSWFASNILDILGIANFTPGTVIQVAAQDGESGIKRFDVERACSGIQSLYTILFCTVAVAVWSRRSFVASIALVLSGILWSITMNGVRIVTCVSFYCWFDFDVYSGFKHELLGYLVLFMAIGLVASTDAFLGFLLGPIDTSAGTKSSIGRLWNRFVAGTEMSSRRNAENRSTRTSPSRLRKTALVAFLCAVNVLAASVLWNSLSPENHSTTMQVEDLGFVATDLPAEIGPQSGSENIWINDVAKYEKVERTISSTYGQYSATWVYINSEQGFSTNLSLDYTFLGWHELKFCYSLNGWAVQRKIGLERDWQTVELMMQNKDGKNGYCIFSIFDYRGESLEPIEDTVGMLMMRIRNKIARELNTKTTFQVQCFVQSSDPITDAEKEAVKKFHLEAREKLRTEVLKRIAIEN